MKKPLEKNNATLMIIQEVDDRNQGLKEEVRKNHWEKIRRKRDDDDDDNLMTKWRNHRRDE